jgi:hypothetical protein
MSAARENSPQAAGPALRRYLRGLLALPFACALGEGVGSCLSGWVGSVWREEKEAYEGGGLTKLIRSR